MIGEIIGIIKRIYESYIIVFVGDGLGYKINLPRKIIAALNIDDKINLLIETRFKVDIIVLFGFETEFSRSIFEILSNISGVGDKLALNLSSLFSANDWLGFINGGSSVKLPIKIDGLGTKTWEKIMFALKGNKKFYNLCLVSLSPSNNSDKCQDETIQKATIINDAIDALNSLGIGGLKAREMVSKIYEEDKSITLENLIKKMLLKSL